MILCCLKVFNGIVLEVPCLGSIEMGTFRSENLRDDGVSTLSKEDVHSLYEITLLHNNFFSFTQIVLKVIAKVRDFINPLEPSSTQLHTGLYLHLPPAENHTHCLSRIVVNTTFLFILTMLAIGLNKVFDLLHFLSYWWDRVIQLIKLVSKSISNLLRINLSIYIWCSFAFGSSFCISWRKSLALFLTIASAIFSLLTVASLRLFLLFASANCIFASLIVSKIKPSDCFPQCTHKLYHPSMVSLYPSS